MEPTVTERDERATRGPWLPLLAWAALGLFVVGAPLWDGARFFYRDVTRQYAPLQVQLDRAWAAGELPWWNASTQGGVPLGANVHAGAFSPHTLLFRLAPFHLAYAWLVFFAWTGLALGTWRLLRHHVGPVEAAAGALVLALSGLTLGVTSYLPFLIGLACIPWQLEVLARPVSGLSLRWVALFALQVLAGDPSTALLGAVACAAWLANRPGGAAREGGWLVLSGLAAIGVTAVQFLPAWTLFEASARASASLETRLGWSFHPARTLEWLVRLPFGQLLEAPYFSRLDLAPGPDGQPFILDHGWGLAAALLVLPGLLRPGPLRRAGLALVTLGLIFASGRFFPLSAALNSVPPLSLFRFPERYDALSALGAALLSAQGLAGLLEAGGPSRRWAGGWLAGAAVLGISAALVDDATLRAALARTALLLGLAGLATAALASRPSHWLAVLALLCAMDWRTARDASRLVLPTTAWEGVRGPVAALHGTTARVWRDNAALRVQERPPRGVEALTRELHAVSATLASATPGLWGVDELGGYSPVALKRWQRVIKAFSQRPDVLFRMFNACWLVSTPERRWPTRFPLTAVEALTPEATLYRYEGCLPRAWAVARVHDVADLDGALAAMGQPGFDPATDAVREGGGASLRPLDGQRRVTAERRASANRIELELGPGGDALVVVSETWALGWTAQVDGVERPVELVDGTLLGVLVPSGAARVSLHYEEPLGAAGAAVSGATALALLLVWRRRQR